MRPLRHFVRLVLVLLALGAVWTVDAAAPVHACSCATPERTRDFEWADAVFIGTIEEVRRPAAVSLRGVSIPSHFPVRFVFDVERVYKGSAFERQSIVTSASGASCGLEISGASRFLMFATTEGQGLVSGIRVGELASSLCSGNSPLGPGMVPTEFGPGYAPQPGSSPIGFGGTSWPMLIAYTVVAGGTLTLAVLGIGRLRRRRIQPAG